MEMMLLSGAMSSLCETWNYVEVLPVRYIRSLAEVSEDVRSIDT